MTPEDRAAHAVQRVQWVIRAKGPRSFRQLLPLLGTRSELWAIAIHGGLEVVGHDDRGAALYGLRDAASALAPSLADVFAAIDAGQAPEVRS